MALVIVLGAAATTLLVVLNVELWGGSGSSYAALPVIWLTAIVGAIWLLAADRRLRSGGDA
jgi:hypothetical protein